MYDDEDSDAKAIISCFFLLFLHAMPKRNTMSTNSALDSKRDFTSRKDRTVLLLLAVLTLESDSPLRSTQEQHNILQNCSVFCMHGEW